MKNCTECNYRFTVLDRLKSAFKGKGYLKCPKCNSTYKPEVTFIKWLYYFLVFILLSEIGNGIARNNLLLRLIVIGFGAMAFFTLYDVIPHRGHKYRKIDLYD